MKRKLKLVLGLVLRRTVLNLKEKKKKTGLRLLLLLKNSKEGFKEEEDAEEVKLLTSLLFRSFSISAFLSSSLDSSMSIPRA